MSCQAKHHISLAIWEVLKIWPEFNALSDPEWPIHEYIRTILKTSSEGHCNLLKKVAKPDEKGGSRCKKVIQQAAAPDPMPPAQLPKATPNEADENSDSTDSNKDLFSAPTTTPATFSTANPILDSTITHAHTASKLPAQLVAQTLPHGQLSTESHAPMRPNLSSPPPSPSNVPTNTKKNKSKEKEKGSGSGSKGKSRAQESDSKGSDLADPNPDYTHTTMDLYSNLTDKDEQISANSVSEPTQSKSVPMPIPKPKMKIRPRPKEKPYPEPELESVPTIPAPPPAPIPTVAPTVPAKCGKCKRVDIDTPSLPSTSALPTHDPAPTDEPPVKKGRKGAAALKTPARPQLTKNFSSPMVATPTQRSTRIINNSKDINSGLFNICLPTKKSNPALTHKKSRK
ncbi:hypothetical protein CTheo_8784 [Ceratobasidium theobromae]|uniref:Uncharacterized protein n=1 Tax=Ceratobasidium theobromae TaxID=1582974 RepID=A0A5N5Q7X6_9AGAM|nr:hypothetical protein CTheo_8784 [Ceratobasidium theobromae]